MRNAAEAYIKGAGESERRWMGKTFTDFLATGEQTGGAFGLVDEVAHRGETVPLHRHTEDDESFYVLDGEIRFYIGEGPARLAGPGTFAHVPGGVVHGFRIESDSARYLIFTTARHTTFYRAITQPSSPGGRPALEPVTDAQIEQACGAFGVEFVGPFPD